MRHYEAGYRVSSKMFSVIWNLFDGGVQLARCLAKNHYTQSKLLYFVIAMNDGSSKRAKSDFQITFICQD